jgi:Polysaccharide deacetylase
MSARPAPVTWPGGVISFTFDDFPESALAAGGDILEGYGARGTYYASLKSPRSDRLRPGFHEDIRAAHRAGHEIACHTYTHPDLHRMTRRMILAEGPQQRRRAFLPHRGLSPDKFRLSLRLRIDNSQTRAGILVLVVPRD